MRERITEALTRRRFGGAVLSLAGRLTRRTLAGAVLLSAGIVLALVVLLPGGDDDAGKRPTTTTKRLPVRIVSAPALGLAFAHPTTWTRTLQGQVFNLRSPDRAT